MQKSATVALISSNRLLLLKRGETAPWNPGKYCLPGGKLEPNDETLIACAARELFEETGIKLSRLELSPLMITYPKYSKLIFVCNAEGLYPVTLNWEHSSYLWTTIHDTPRIDLVPGLGVTIKTLGDSGYLI
jgi:8-oxo-dGTP pyrophosphatase MutT (NUDIX family)